MSAPDIQYFAESGTWHKPAGAVRVDCLIKAADAGAAILGYGAPCAWGDGGGGGGAGGIPGLAAGGGAVTRRAEGELHVKAFRAGEIPETMEIEIGRGGRGAALGGIKAGDGAGGYALILTHLG